MHRLSQANASSASRAKLHNRSPLPLVLMGGAAGRLEGGRPPTVSEGQADWAIAFGMPDTVGVRT
jgi:hypothetical protein